MPPAGFEPAIPASERPHTHALGRAATGIGYCTLLRFIYCFYGLATFPINRVRVRKHECSDDTNNAEELHERFIEPSFITVFATARQISFTRSRNPSSILILILSS